MLPSKPNTWQTIDTETFSCFGLFYSLYQSQILSIIGPFVSIKRIEFGCVYGPYRGEIVWCEYHQPNKIRQTVFKILTSFQREWFRIVDKCGRKLSAPFFVIGTINQIHVSFYFNHFRSTSTLPFIHTVHSLSLSLYLLNRRLFIHRYYMSVEVFHRVYQLIVRAAAAWNSRMIQMHSFDVAINSIRIPCWWNVKGLVNQLQSQFISGFFRFIVDVIVSVVNEMLLRNFQWPMIKWTEVHFVT